MRDSLTFPLAGPLPSLERAGEGCRWSERRPVSQPRKYRNLHAMLRPSTSLLLCLALCLAPLTARAAEAPAPERVTTPVQFFGHQLGADYVLPNYQQLTAYWRK